MDTNFPAKEKDALLQSDLEYAIAQLPHGYRQVLVLHDIEGYKHHEIAQMLGLTEGTSKSQLFNARKAVRTILQPKSIEDEPR